MKKMKQLVFVVALLTLAICSESNAQCSYVYVNNGNTEIIPIPCDFPLYVDTQNPPVDSANYNTLITQWGGSHPELMPLELNSGTYIVIPNAEFILFTTARQNEILALPNYYHVNP